MRGFLALLCLCAVAAKPVDPPEIAILKAQGVNVGPIQTGGGLSVSFQDFKLDETGWHALETLPDLKSLTIGNARTLGDADFARLCGIKSLEQFFVNGFGGTDQALASLARLPNLRHFGADHSPFTGKALIALKDSPNFVSLRFGGCPFDDDGLKALGELTQMKDANISHLRFTSVGFPSLAKLVNLEKLSISPAFEPYYISSDFTALSGLKHFKTLVVSEMALPYEDGLDHLKNCPLERLELHDCRVSDSDLEKVKADHPGATVIRDYSFEEKYKRWDMLMEKRKKASASGK